MLNTQYSLFETKSNYENTECQTNHIESPLSKPIENADDQSFDQGCPTLLEYATDIAHEIWEGETHRKSAMRGITWFSAYKDFGKLTLDEIQRKHIYEFTSYLKKTRGIKGSTSNRYKTYITRVLNEAVEKEVTQNEVRVKHDKEQGGRPRRFTQDEEARLIKHLREQNADWFADMVILSCNTGMRRGEILAIKDPSVQLEEDNEWLFLPKHVCKTEERLVPFNEKALAAYKRLLVSIDSYTEKKFSNYWNKARRDIARGDKHFVFHVCRHTAASRLSDKGFSQRDIGDILGHADERTTSKYIHSNKSRLLGAVKTL